MQSLLWDIFSVFGGKTVYFLFVNFFLLVCSDRAHHKDILRQPCFAFNRLLLLFSLLLYILFEIASLTSGHCDHDNQRAVCSHIALIKGTAAGMVSARVSWGLRWLFKCFSLNLIKTVKTKSLKGKKNMKTLYTLACFITTFTLNQKWTN